MKLRSTLAVASAAAGMSLTLAPLAGCSSTPKPVVPDGSSRVAANEPSRIQELTQRVVQDRALLSENAILKAQVQALNRKVDDMSTILRDALLLPKAESVQPQAAPPAPTSSSSTIQPPASPQSNALSELPPFAYSPTATGSVVRVFHPFARTEFEPSEDVAKLLRASIKNAKKIVVIGHTDSNTVNAIDKKIARERARGARSWLVKNGADPSKIRIRYVSAGDFLTDNTTLEGRSLNRRVEIDFRTTGTSSDRVARLG